MKCHYDKCKNETKRKYCSLKCCNNDKIGKKHSEETKEKMSKSAIGKKHSPERVEKFRKRIMGNKFGLGNIGWGASNWKKKGITLSDEHKIKISKANTGKKRSKKSKNNYRNAALKRTSTGSKYAHYYDINGILCQCKSEKKYIENLIKENKILPTKPDYIKTPYGLRLIDFEYPDRFIEIKSKFTFKKYIGSDQEIKDKWISENIKLVEIIVI